MLASTARLDPVQLAIAYAVVFVAIGALDAAWLGWLARDLYKEEMGDLLLASPRVVPAALFYLLYPVAVVYLALYRLPESLAEAATRAAVLGLAAYGAYDLTNLAVIRGWSLKLSVIDMAWGMFATALAGSAAYAWVSRSAD